MNSEINSIIDDINIISTHRKKIKAVRKAKPILDKILPKFSDVIMDECAESKCTLSMDDRELLVEIVTDNQTPNTATDISLGLQMRFFDLCDEMLGENSRDISHYVFDVTSSSDAFVDSKVSLHIVRKK